MLSLVNCQLHCMSSRCLLERAASLGCHPVSHNNAPRSRLTKRPVRFAEINGQEFVYNVVEGCIDVNAHDDINDLADTLTSELYRCAVQSKCRQDAGQENESLTKWERIVQDKGDARVWRASDWKGDIYISANANDSVHFERILSSTQSPHYDDVTTGLSIHSYIG